MLYLLDTDVLIDYSRGIEPATSTILGWIDGTDTVAVCAITVAEFYAGLMEAQASSWTPFFASLPYWHISRVAAMRAGEYRHRFARAGHSLTTTDALLAAVAVEQGATLVTRKVKDFPMEGLTLLALR
jgi:predicted nucleic acid-binding protein